MKGGGLAIVVLAIAAPAHASSLDLFGFGMRSPGMAGTGTAFADDYEAVYANPAGLAIASAKRATVGAALADFDLRFDGAGTATESVSALVFGGVVPLPLGGWARDRIALGLGSFVPTDTLNKARAPFPGQPNFALLDGRAKVVAIQFGVGVRVSREWTVGASLIALAALRGAITLTASPSGRVTSVSEQRIVTQFAPLVGARWQRGSLTVGGVARAPSRSDYDVHITNNFADTLGIGLPELRIAGAAQYDPLTVAAEVAWRRGALLLAGQVAWQHWSAYPLPSQNPTPETPAQQPPGFHDTAVPRVGVEYAVAAGKLQVSARGGMALLLSPAPEQTGQQSLLDNHRLLTSVGLGVEGPSGLRLDAFGQAHFLVERSHRKDPEQQPPGTMPAFDQIRTDGRVWAAGIALGLEL